MTEENNTTYGKEVGNVIWFDQKKGFGFIRIITPNSEFLNKEIFVHYSNINCLSRFKKLYPGENVSVAIAESSGRFSLSGARRFARRSDTEDIPSIPTDLGYLGNISSTGRSSHRVSLVGILYQSIGSRSGLDIVFD